MTKKVLWLVVSGLMALSLVMAACGPAAAPTTPTAPATPTKPVEEKAQQEVVASQAEMVKVMLTKLDGTKMEKMVEKPKYGGTLNIRTTSDPNWDLQGGTITNHGLALNGLLFGDWSKGTAGTGEISWQIYEYMSMDHFMGALAERWETPDDETIIYHLRPGVRWALDGREASKLVGGRELTADDVVFSLKFAFFSQPEIKVRNSFGGEENADIRATDKHTVVVKAPRQDLAQFMGFMSDRIPIVSPEVIQKYGIFTKWDQLVGTGAFMIKDYVPGSVATWVKNPNYYGYDPVLGKDYPLPYVGSIRELNIPDVSTAIAAFRTGKIDATPGGTGGKLISTKEMWENLLKTTPHTKTKIVNFGTSSQRIAMQMNNKRAPWQDIRVRRALMMAINHQEIVDTYYSGGADLQAFPLPGAPELYAIGWAIPLEKLPVETQKLYEYHPDEAKQLLKEAGYPNGFKTSIMLSSGGGSTEWLDLATLLKNYWAKIGVDLTLDIKDAAVFSGYSNRADYPDMMNASSWGTATLYTKLDPPPSGFNVGNIVDPHIQELRLKMFDVLWDVKKRTPIMKELYEYTMSQVWYLSLPSGWQ